MNALPPWRSLPRTLTCALTRALHAGGPGTIAAAITLIMSLLGAWNALERSSYSALFWGRHRLFPRQWDDRLVVVAIDEKTLKALDQFPLARRHYAELLRQLSTADPAAIGFDILFAESTPDDAALHQELELATGVVIAQGHDPRGRVISLIPSLAQIPAGLNVGVIASKTDPDGIVRAVTPYPTDNPTFALALVKTYQATLAGTLSTSPAVARAHTQSLALPLPARHNPPLWVNWPAPIESDQSSDRKLTYSFVDVLRGEIPTNAFKDKIILVGETATGIDLLRTPYEQSPPSAGVYLHAALVDNLLNQRLLYPLPQVWIPGLFLVVGIGTSWLAAQRGPRGMVLLIGGLAMFWYAIALALFSSVNLWLPIAAPLGTMLITSMVVELREQHDKKLLRELFDQHVSPEMASVLWDNRHQLLTNGNLAPQEQTATVLFMDIRGFTTTTETLPPSDLLPWLNRYLTLASQAIREHGGVVDKYIGDAVMAVFGIPIKRTELAQIQADAQQAIAASLTILERLKTLNATFQQEGYPPIHVGFGIHTGPVIAGSLGGANRLNYSVVGDTVNIAARLEPMNKALTGNNPYPILISEATWHHSQTHYDAHCVGDLQLRGRQGTTKVYAIAGKNSGQQTANSG